MVDGTYPAERVFAVLGEVSAPQLDELSGHGVRSVPMAIVLVLVALAAGEELDNVDRILRGAVNPTDAVALPGVVDRVQALPVRHAGRAEEQQHPDSSNVVGLGGKMQRRLAMRLQTEPAAETKSRITPHPTPGARLYQSATQQSTPGRAYAAPQQADQGHPMTKGEGREGSPAEVYSVDPPPLPP